MPYRTECICVLRGDLAVPRRPGLGVRGCGPESRFLYKNKNLHEPWHEHCSTGNSARFGNHLGLGVPLTARIIDKRQHRRCGSGERPHARPTGGGASMHTVTLSVTARARAPQSPCDTHCPCSRLCRPALPVFIGKVFISIARTPERRTLRCNTARGPPPSQWTAIHRGSGEAAVWGEER